MRRLTREGEEGEGKGREETGANQEGRVWIHSPLRTRKKGPFNGNLCNIKKKGKPTILSHASNGNDNHGKVLTFPYQGFLSRLGGIHMHIYPASKIHAHTPLKSAR